MKIVYVAKREYERANYEIIGIYETEKEAEEALTRDKANGYGESHSVETFEMGKYYGIL